MSKNGALVILNDLKKRRDELQDKYIKQRNKKFTDNQVLLYTFGFVCVLGATCFVFPTNMIGASCILVGYGLGVPFTYSFVQYNKEENLKNELNKYNKQIDRLELELTGIKVNHHYVDEKRGFVFNENGVPCNDINLESEHVEDINILEESGPVLKRKF